MIQPREGDLPRDELEAEASRVHEDYARRGIPVDFHFKFTCAHCGQRCTLDDPNKLYEFGECFKCGKETAILFGGFSLHIHLPKGAQT